MENFFQRLLPSARRTEPQQATDTNARDVSALLEVPIKRHSIPAMACAIIWKGRVTAQGVAGVRKAGSQEPATLSDRWHLGSCTKSMTATLAAILDAEGIVSLNTTLQEGLGNVVQNIHPRWRNVTLDLLLHHRGGAPNELHAHGLWSELWQFGGNPSQARLLLAKGVLARPPEVRPGTKYIYSNAGYALVGAVLENITGIPWETLLQERVWKPLGIASGSFGAPGVRNGRVVDAPRGHKDDGTPVEPGPGSDNPSAIGPAGTVAMTIGDWARYVALHLEAGRSDFSPRLLSSEAFQKLHSPLPNDEAAYAMGWISVAEGLWGGRALTHSGSNTMWYCTVWVYQDYAILVTSNQGGEEARKACDEVVQSLKQNHQEHNGNRLLSFFS